MRGFGAALMATIVIAIGEQHHRTGAAILTFPITFLTLGLFLLVLNAFC